MRLAYVAAAVVTILAFAVGDALTNYLRSKFTDA